MSGSLVVLVDGEPMPEPDARAFWQRFSDWMEEHRGDLAGFAKAEGFASVHPGVDGGRPVLRASRSNAQRPYAPAKAEGGPGGSPSRHGGPSTGPGRRANGRKSRGKRPS